MAELSNITSGGDSICRLANHMGGLSLGAIRVGRPWNGRNEKCKYLRSRFVLRRDPAGKLNSKSIGYLAAPCSSPAHAPPPCLLEQLPLWTDANGLSRCMAGDGMVRW
jgi:hypothetical protein